jgi:hypothetical protein
MEPVAINPVEPAKGWELRTPKSIAQHKKGNRA